MSHHSTVLIIGGGVIGSSIALEMMKENVDITILEKGAFLSEATTASAGMICPQAVMFDAEAPVDMLRETDAVYQKWIEELEDISRVPVQFVKEGMIRLVFTETEKERTKKALATNKTVSWLNPEEMKKIEPAIDSDPLGGVLFPNDGQLHPHYLAKSLYTALQRQNCLIKQWLPALNLITREGRVVGARTPEGDFFADTTIVTAGAWSSALFSQFDIDLPIYPVKGQMFSIRSEDVSVTKTVQGPDGMIIPRLDGTLTVGVTHEEVGFNKISNMSGISAIQQSVTKLISQLKEAEFLKSWAGLRPGTPDGLPYIGEIEGVDGLMVASGHSGIGILLAPMTARIINQIFLDKKPGVDLQPFHPKRFQR